MNTYQIIAQIVALIIIVLMAVGSHPKTQNKILLYQVSINFLYIIHYKLLGADVAVVISIINTIRTFIFFLYGTKNKHTPLWLLIMIFAISIGAGIYRWTDWTSIFPILATLIYTYGQWQLDPQNTRKSIIGGDICWVIYNFFVFGYVNLIGKIIEIISTSIAHYRYSITHDLTAGK